RRSPPPSTGTSGTSRPCSASLGRGAGRAGLGAVLHDRPDRVLEAREVAVEPDAALLLVGDGTDDDTRRPQDRARVCRLDGGGRVHDRARVQPAVHGVAARRVPLEDGAVEVAGAVAPVLVLRAADAWLEHDALHALLAVRVREPLEDLVRVGERAEHALWRRREAHLVLDA